MKINVNLLDPSIMAASSQDPISKCDTKAIELNSPLERLSKNEFSGEEVVGLLQKYGLLSQLQRELIIDAALESSLHRSGCANDCTAEEIFSAYKAFYQQQQINSDEDRAAWLERNHITLSQLEHALIRSIKLDRFKRETFASKVDSYFLHRKSQLDRASYSLLRVKNFHLAQELFFRIQAGEATFPELVKQYSEGQEAETGRSIGPHELSVPHPILATKLRSLQSGQLSPPLQIADWFVIIRLEKYLAAQLDEKMRIRLIDELYNRWIQEQLNKLKVDTLK